MKKIWQSKVLWLTLLIAGALAALSGCTATTENTTDVAADTDVSAGVYQTITPQEGKQLLDSDSGVILVDVREQSEYDDGHIPGAILLPLGQINDQAATVLPDQAATIIVYCRSGRRSQSAANALLSLGYTNVLDMGGISSWPYDVVTD